MTWFPKVRLTDFTDDADVDQYGGQVTIDYAHHECHAANFYTYTQRWLTASAPTGASFNVLFRTAGKNAHTLLVVNAGGRCDYSIVESAVVGISGTADTIYNNHRSSTAGASASVRYSCAYSAGVTIFRDVIGGGTGGGGAKQSSGNEIRPGTEFILKQNCDYIVEVQDSSNELQNIAIKIGFYEE